MTDLSRLSLVEAADGVREKLFSARELLDACLARVERLGTALNCFIAVWEDDARAAAAAIDRRIAAGETVGPLAGVPLAHKDMFYRTGRTVTCGSKIRREFVPDVTASVLRRLDDADALHIGALNMAEFAFGGTGHNAHFGPCRNPWNTEHITGGSSSGSAAATAARLVFGSLGSDTGGSVRLPAAACGVVGLKGTQTRVSRFGVMGLSFSLDNVGPLARSVRDCARLFGVIAGHDPLDATSSRRPVADYESQTVAPQIAGLRVGVPTSYYYDETHPEIRAALDASLERFRELGAEIVDVAIPEHEHLATLANVVMASEAATLHGAWLRERPLDYGAQVRARIEAGFAITATQYLEAIQVRTAIIARFVEAVFSRCDVLHAPVIDHPLPTIADTDVRDGQGFVALMAKTTRCTRPFNYLGLPSMTVPCGFTTNGLPIAFQLAGRPFAEAGLFRAGAAYQAATDWHTRLPVPAS